MPSEVSHEHICHCRHFTGFGIKLIMVLAVCGSESGAGLMVSQGVARGIITSVTLTAVTNSHLAHWKPAF